MMKQPFPTPVGFAERSYIDSGAIGRQGYADFGVVFTHSPGHSPSDFDPAALRGLLLEHAGLRGQQEDRFFTIAGGYYLSTERVNGVLQPRTEQVFGVALERGQGFEIAEGGHTVLSDHWQLKDPLPGKHPVAAMRERDFIGGAVSLDEQTGWTFIVAEAKADPALYPPSRAPLALFLPCPELQGLQLSSRMSGEGTVEVTARANVQGSDPEAYIWDWGDASPPEMTAAPMARHVFPRPAGAARDLTVTLRIKGPGSCEASASAELRIPPLCPVIQDLSYESREITDSVYEVHFQALPVGPPPDRFQWDWGDGSPKEQTAGPEARHRYSLTPGGPHGFDVKVWALGPDACQSESHLHLTLGRPCPDIRGLSEHVVATGKATVTLEFRVDYKGEKPDRYRWNWNDGSPEEVTATDRVRHVFTRPSDKTASLQVTIDTEGPGACRGHASTLVTIAPVAVECPTILEFHAELEEATPDEQEVYARVSLRGPAPDRFEWDWGDGSEIQTTLLPRASHRYKRPAKTSERRSILVKAYGPGYCESAARTGTEIPVREKKPVTSRPLWCRFFLGLAGLLAGLFLGCLAVWYAGLRYPESLPGTEDWPLPLALGMGGALAVLLGIWRQPGRQGRSWVCPPSSCDAYAIALMGFLTATAVNFYLLECTGPLWQVSCGLAFVLAVLSGYFWFRFCGKEGKAIRLFVFLMVAASATAIVILFIANAYLGCLQ